MFNAAPAMGSRTLFSNGYGPEIQLSDPRDTLENVQKNQERKTELTNLLFIFDRKTCIRKVILGKIV